MRWSLLLGGFLGFYAGIALGSVPILGEGVLFLEPVTELSRAENTTGHLFHAGRLWVSHSFRNGVEKPTLETYDAHGKYLDEVQLSHPFQSIHPYDANRVLVTHRIKPPHWRTAFSILRVTAKKRPVVEKVYTFAEDNQVTGFLNLPGKQLFSLIDKAILQYPSETKLPVKVSFPGKMIFSSPYLFVVERKMNSEFTNIVRIDLSNNQTKKAFEFFRHWITDMALLNGKDLLIASETGDDQVLFLKASTNELASTIALPTPRSIVLVGGCALVSSQAEKAISLIDLNGVRPTLVETWDLSFAGNLSNTRFLDFDPATRNFFIRAINPSSDGASSVSFNRVFKLEVGRRSQFWDLCR